MTDHQHKNPKRMTSAASRDGESADSAESDEVKLARPHKGMAPEEKGRLLLRYLEAGLSVRGRDFSGAIVPVAAPIRVNSWLEYEKLHYELQEAYGFISDVNAPYAFDDAVLNGILLADASLESRHCRNASFLGADLRRTNLANAFLQDANLADADLTGADLRYACIEGACLLRTNLAGANIEGTIADMQTVTLSEWPATTVRDLKRRGLKFPQWDDFPANFRDQVDKDVVGITLTFDTRLHRFDLTAFDALIAEVLGPDTDVTIEERSNIGAAGPAFVRINGSRAEDLVTIAEAFYDRIWQATKAMLKERALLKVSPGMLLLRRLDEMRDRLIKLEAHQLFAAVASTSSAEATLLEAKHAESRFGAVVRDLANEVKLRHDPLDASAFVARLEADLHAAIQNLTSQRNYLQHWEGSEHKHDNENNLRSRLVAFLSARTYEASAETEEGGSTDILVKCAKLDLLWIGECKVYSSLGNLDEGMCQLHTRYASGMHPALGFIIFCFQEDAASVATRWKTHLNTKKLCGMIGDPVDDPQYKLSFSTKHRHKGSGLEVVTKHIVVPLHWRPMDKSGRRSLGRRE